MSDEGFILTYFQQFFNDPESVSYCVVYWFTGFVGGLWNMIIPNAGIFSFRILGVMVIGLTIIYTFKSFKSIVSINHLMISTSLILINWSYDFKTFSYNPLGALLLLIGIFLMLKGLMEKKYIFMFFLVL